MTKPQSNKISDHRVEWYAIYDVYTRCFWRRAKKTQGKIISLRSIINYAKSLYSIISVTKNSQGSNRAQVHCCLRLLCFVKT